MLAARIIFTIITIPVPGPSVPLSGGVKTREAT